MIAMEYATDGERAVARKLVNAALAQGYNISVNDGEEWTVKRSVSTTEITRALCTTGEDYIRVQHKDGTSVGVFQLIWGNASDGSELIADHTDTITANELYNIVYPN